jgi:hypothetical protein
LCWWLAPDIYTSGNRIWLAGFIIEADHQIASVLVAEGQSCSGNLLLSFWIPGQSSSSARYYAILVLLLSLIATRGDDPLVVKDSEAVQYVGKNVEVRGIVVSVTTSPLGTTFNRFRTRIPQLDIRRVHSDGVKKGDCPVGLHAPRENHRHHRHDRTLPTEAGD